ncbi:MULTISPECIES: hypothetical protein [unclassified Legionella]|uniref:hypothetical protein n=1 Tax=Legionella sp. PC997 TaxID=2755562 RepID=UPI0015FC9BF1|nr:hypothetical protein [Legionella sp. PC997]QMT59163.1 hypothetical protein HBNCFIEN_00524 [Legionella sp. PC997]
MNKKFYALFLVLSLQSFKVVALSDNEQLLKQFHNYGMTHCDKFILMQADLLNKPNRSIDIESPIGELGQGYSTVTLIITYGYKGDTIKQDLSFIETPNRCILTKRATLTSKGPCSQNINPDYWYISKSIPQIDYTSYRNKGDAPMLAKEINVGDFKACIQEFRLTSDSKHD